MVNINGIGDSLKIDFVTPIDIKYSYRATEVQIYEYSKFMIESGVESNVLVPTLPDTMSLPKARTDYQAIHEYFKKVPEKSIRGKKVVLPFNYTLYLYSGLPRDSVIYFAYSIYDHIWNVLTKPRGQKYVIAAHSMHLKDGHIIEGHRILESFLNFFMKVTFSIGDAKRNVYHHVITTGEAEYLKRLGISEKNIIYVPTFVDTTVFRPRKNGSDKLQVMHIGGIDKDVSVVIGFINRMRDMGILDLFEFYFIGNNQEAELLDLSEKSSTVHCFTAIDEEQKANIMSKMDVMLIPAVESFSRSMLEGLSSGLYIIADSRNPAASEIKSKGGKIALVGKDVSQYIEELKNLKERKLASRSNFYSDRVTSRDIIIREYDKAVVLRKILEMFMVVAKRG